MGKSPFLPFVSRQPARTLTCPYTTNCFFFRDRLLSATDPERLFRLRPIFRQLAWLAGCHSRKYTGGKALWLPEIHPNSLIFSGSSKRPSKKRLAEPVPTSGDAIPQAAPVTEPASTAPTAEKVAAAEQTREAENQAGDAAGQVVDAKESLKAVTDEFVNEHTAALKKEAQIFGELFAASCMEQMNKVAALQKVEQNAYATTVDALSAVNEAELMNKTAAIYDEAYFTTLAKFAGLESPEELQSILGRSPRASLPKCERRPWPLVMRPKLEAIVVTV